MTGDNRQNFRLFVAIPIPEPFRNEIIAIQRELKPLALGDVRWTNPEQLHLTLKFLGNVAASAVPSLKSALTEACAGVQPFVLRARGIGFFPNERQPRVIWVGFEDDKNVLAGLQNRVERLIAPFAEKSGSPRGVTTNHANQTADNSTPRGKEQFLAHATLGRFQKYRRYKTEQLVPCALTHQHRVFGEWQVEEVILFRSELSTGGARHSPVAVFPLGAKLER